MDEFQSLIARIMALSPEEKRQIVSMLTLEVTEAQRYEVREPAAAYSVRNSTDMKAFTLVLPNELIKEAQAAGLLVSGRIEELLRQTLRKHASADASLGQPQQRRLIRHNGRLIVEALPGEPQISDEDVRKALEDMEE